MDSCYRLLPSSILNMRSPCPFICLCFCIPASPYVRSFPSAAPPRYGPLLHSSFPVVPFPSRFPSFSCTFFIALVGFFTSCPLMRPFARERVMLSKLRSPDAWMKHVIESYLPQGPAQGRRTMMKSKVQATTTPSNEKPSHID